MFNFSPHHKPIIHIKHENNNHLPRRIFTFHQPHIKCLMIYKHVKKILYRG